MKNLMFYIKFAIILLVLSWVMKALAEPPSALIQEVAQHQDVFRGKCSWRGYHFPCQIFYRQADDSIFLVLNNGKRITYIVHVTNKRVEAILYENPQYST